MNIEDLRIFAIYSKSRIHKYQTFNICTRYTHKSGISKNFLFKFVLVFFFTSLERKNNEKLLPKSNIDYIPNIVESSFQKFHSNLYQDSIWLDRSRAAMFRNTNDERKWMIPRTKCSDVNHIALRHLGIGKSVPRVVGSTRKQSC